MSYDLFVPCEIKLPMEIAMRPEEQRGLDLFVHLTMPEIIVQTGTWKGGSAWILSEHAPVVAIDHDPIVEINDFAKRPFPVRFLECHSPDQLEMAAPLVKGKRWLFFHDSVHFRRQLLAELSWARAHGAYAALWHDVALNEGWYPSEETMLSALKELQVGFHAKRMQHFGTDEALLGITPMPDAWTGLGCAWFK